jgi:hypothetical protein
LRQRIFQFAYSSERELRIEYGINNVKYVP